MTAFGKGLADARAGRQEQRPFLDGLCPTGAAFLDADPVPEQPVVSPAQHLRFAGRIGVGEGHLQLAGTRAAVFLDRAGRAGRKKGQAGGNKHSVHRLGGFSDCIGRRPVVGRGAESDVHGAGLVLFRVL